ncbi:hypothetical protein CspeluHIS016_0303700 [Cutaneotrichosporon spelunceum]|uniref:RlpA-like protein double-psi beta-barrel domain-containing protein n=1 Tax=Cutaneotrichosporon spelunceum TaxID=1672016 RepID=A0AAD3TU51_9TREE|nr:hypothetical protein CspeluHIS016_0303700 [Cutaneotrichosporon spelunceum]
MRTTALLALLSIVALAEHVAPRGAVGSPAPVHAHPRNRSAAERWNHARKRDSEHLGGGKKKCRPRHKPKPEGEGDEPVKDEGQQGGDSQTPDHPPKTESKPSATDTPAPAGQTTSPEQATPSSEQQPSSSEQSSSALPIQSPSGDKLPFPPPPPFPPPFLSPGGKKHTAVRTTWYDPPASSQPGACGRDHTKDDWIIAVRQDFFDHFPGAVRGNSYANPLCGKKVLLEYQGLTAEVAIEDSCAHGCQNYHDIDLTPAVFKFFHANSPTPENTGELEGLTWTILD